MSINKATIKLAINSGVKILHPKKLLRESAYLDSELLLSQAIKKSREYILSHPEKLVSEKQKKLFFHFIERRMAYEPIAYIMGKKEFYGREFFVNKNVLIPRPATETLVEETLKHIYKLPATNYKLKIVDIGTGSGCIAITLAKEIPWATIYATDISPKVLKVAKKNAKTNNAKITFLGGNLLEPVKNKKIDIFIANLPYLNPKQKNKYKKFLAYEPKIALYANNQGLKYYERLFRQIADNNICPKLIICEALKQQSNFFKKIIAKLLPSYKISFKNIGQITIVRCIYSSN